MNLAKGFNVLVVTGSFGAWKKFVEVCNFNVEGRSSKVDLMAKVFVVLDLEGQFEAWENVVKICSFNVEGRS